MTTPTENPMSVRLKRRRILPLASTATATALGIAGCAMNSHSTSAPAAPDARQATQLVKSYTSDIEMALDKVDRDRLRAAAEKKNQTSQTIVQVRTGNSADTAAPPPAPGHSFVASTPPMPTDPASGMAAADPAPAPEASVVVFKPVPGASAPPVSATAAPPAPAASPMSTPVPAGKSGDSSPRPVASGQSPGGTRNVKAATPAIQQPRSSIGNPAVNSLAPAVALAPGLSVSPVPAAARPTSVDAQSPNAVLVASPLVFPDTTSTMSGLAMSPSDAAASPLAPDPASDAATPASDSATSGDPATSAMVAMSAVAVPQTPDPTATPAPEASVDDALAVLRKNAGEHPTLSTALALALLENKPDGQAGDLLKSLTPADQKLAADLLAALDTMKTPQPNASLSDRAAPLRETVAKWQAETDLTLPRLALATRVDSFGVFTEAPSAFEQGKRHTVIIYCEVANFGSQKEGDWYATRLSQQESLITEDGLLVWRPNPEDIEDRSRNQRHDFYLVKKLTLPETLAAGKYILRMTVTDKTRNKTAVINRPIEIVIK
jgi:hypothetical protein